MARTVQNPVNTLIAQLDLAGVSASFARKALPAWWNDEIGLSKSGLQQAQMYFARAFHLDLASLSQPQPAVRFKETQRKFKLSRNVQENDVSVSAHFATAMANVALTGFNTEQMAVPPDPLALRANILQTHTCVSLGALLDWCTKAHIPILHIHALPGKKMTGLVVREDGRFAIVLSRKGTPAHLLFHLAHELGHIAHGHLQKNGFVVDEQIGKDQGDADEKEADAYAIRLLNGQEVSYKPSTSKAIPNGRALYNAALKRALEDKIDVGHIILNYGNTQKCHALATTALKYISGESDGIKVVNQGFFKALNIEKLSEDQLDLLKTITCHAA